MARVPSGESQRSRRAYKAAWEKSGSGRTSRMLGGNKVRTPKGERASSGGSGSSSATRTESRERYTKTKPGEVSFGRTGYVEDFDV